MKKRRDEDAEQPELFPGEIVRDAPGPLRVSQKGKTTIPGYANRNRQMVIGRVAGQSSEQLYELRCGDCGLRYPAKGSEIYERKCPRCQGGR